MEKKSGYTSPITPVGGGEQPMALFREQSLGDISSKEVQRFIYHIQKFSIEDIVPKEVGYSNQGGIYRNTTGTTQPVYIAPV